MVRFLRVKRVMIVRIFVGIDVVLRIACGWRDGNIEWFMGVEIFLLTISIYEESILICVDYNVLVFFMKIHVILAGVTTALTVICM